MEALRLKDDQLFYDDSYPDPEPEAGEVKVRVLLAGICSTDLEMVRGYVPDFEGVLGHEFVGIVETPDSAWHGRRVVGSISKGCGQCELCQLAGEGHCSRRLTLGIRGWDGAFATYLTMPERHLHPVPDVLSNETAVFTEPLAAALRIHDQVRIRPSQRVAVIGPGRLGLLIAQVLALNGTNITVLGRSQQSLQFPQTLGLPVGLTADFDDNTFDMVVEVTGNEAGFAQAVRLVRPLGTIILKSTFAGLPAVDLSRLVVKEIQLVGSRCGPFDAALRLLAQNRINVTDFIHHEYPLREGLRAFDHASQRGVLKILLRPD